MSRNLEPTASRRRETRGGLQSILDRLPVISCGPAEDPQGTPRALELLESLGQGATGEVLLAWQHTLEREVAIKRVQHGLHTQETTEALLAEARLMGRLEHPNILPVHALGRSDTGEPLMVMKRVEGVDWRELILHPDHPYWAERDEDQLAQHLKILIQVCNALKFAHSRGVVHLDLKPDNVMVGDFGEVYLLDWGLARELGHPPDDADTRMLGTPAYMAPELLHGSGAASEASDVFLVGATLHEVLTGQPRHAGATVMETLVSVAHCGPVEFGPEVPVELAEICNRACHVDPAQRFPSVETFQRSIEGYSRFRWAHRLCQAADVRLAELERLATVGEGPDRDEEGARRTRALFNECRFGYEQALRAWPRSTTAERGLQRCLETMAELELEWWHNHSGALALVGALPRPRPDLGRRADDLRLRLEREGDALEQLEQLRIQTTFQGYSKNRSVGMTLNGVIWALFFLLLSLGRRLGWIDITPWVNFWLGLGTLAAFSGSVLVLKRLFLDNRIRRQFTTATFVYVGAFVVNRVAALVLAMPLERALMGDYMAALVFVGMLASLLHPVLWWGLGATVAGMIGCAVFPGVMLEIVAANALLINLLLAYVMRPLPAPSR